jgi:hypothetical protein
LHTLFIYDSIIDEPMSDAVDACIDTNVIIDLTTAVGIEQLDESDPKYEKLFDFRLSRQRNALAAAWLCERNARRTFLYWQSAS